MTKQNCANSEICYVPVPYSMGYKHLNVYVTDEGRLKHLRQNEIEISDVIGKIRAEQVSEKINKETSEWEGTRVHITNYNYKVDNQFRTFYFEVYEFDNTKTYTPGEICYSTDNKIYQSQTENINSLPESNPNDWIDTGEIALVVKDENAPDFDSNINIGIITVKDNVRNLYIYPIDTINYEMNITLRDDFYSKSVNGNEDYYIITTDTSSNYYTVVPDFNPEEPVQAIPIIDYDKYKDDENLIYFQFYKELDENTIQWYKATQYNYETNQYDLIPQELKSETDGSNVYVNYKLNQDSEPIVLLSKKIETNGKINFKLNVSEEIYSPATIIYYLTDLEKNKLLIDYNGRTYNYIHKNVINTLNSTYNHEKNKYNILSIKEYFNNINSNIIRLKHKILQNDAFKMVVNNKKIERVEQFNSNNHQCMIKNDVVYTNFNINSGDNVYFEYEYYIDEVYLEVIISVNSKVNKTISPEIKNINLEFLDDRDIRE